MSAPAPTPQQQRAITARGNVLVVAGAGAGKTQTVVDRCLAWLLDEKNPGSIDEVLMVTFTNAAAAEMRQRLRENLEKAQAQLEKSGQATRHLAEQLALLDSAHICTLHSFCFQLVSRHFYELGLDPQTRVLPEDRARLLERESLDLVLDQNYASDSLGALAIQQLIQAQGGDWDKPVRELILRLHHYSQTLRDPAGWFAGQNALFQQSQPAQWLEWLLAEMPKWRNAWLTVLRAQPAENKNAAECARILSALPEKPDRAQFSAALEAIAAADAAPWPKPKERWRKPIEKMFDEADFLRSICVVGETDPLAQDWFWTRPSMLALLDLADQFARAYAGAKQREGGIDYHDLEQFALRLLWKNDQPGEIALQWREKLSLVFVDEYQDINEAQAAIIQALAREGAEANLFLVGDVKQSIYGFRLADPRIFAQYHETWASDSAASVIPLTENFRSHETILQFVNALFTGLMRREMGGIEYNADACLRFGNSAGRAHLAVNPSVTPPVELLLRRLGAEPDGEEDESASDAEMEARMVGLRLLELKNQPALIFDKTGRQQEIKWGDMVVLLRSIRHKAESYAKEFARLGIPLAASRGGFFESIEVRDLLGLLQVLDNPLQDLPLLGVLHSPLVGLTADDLATIRIGREHGRYWNALNQWHKTSGPGPAREKLAVFLERFARWRKLGRRAAVSHCLETIIDETHYGEWIAGQERGRQKRANVERLLQMTRQFDAYEGESLYRFLRFVEAQQENEIDVEPAVTQGADVVRLMTIHQSKGLEFPIVVVADLGKAFNLEDLKKNIILDEEYGLSPRIQPPETPQFYPSLPYWLAKRRQKQKILGEEMRLLYVALTRAGQRLMLAGTTGKKAVEEKWPSQPPATAANRYLDWLGPWLLRVTGLNALADAGANQLLTWTIYDENDPRLAAPEPARLPANPQNMPTVSEGELQERLAWQYPFRPETGQPAKTTVTKLRQKIADDDGDEAYPLFAPQPSRQGPERLTAAEIGSAHHTFLQLMSLEKTPHALALKAEADRLARRSLLTLDEAAALDFDAIADFWQSETGTQLLAHAPALKREFPFTARLTAADLRFVGGMEMAGVGQDEFVVVQGVMDLVALLPDQIWLLDFKTDRFPPAGLEEKIRAYRPQLALYALALERIHRRPVTRQWLHFLALRRTIQFAS